MPPVDRPEILRLAWILKKYGQGMGCIQIASRSGLALLDVIRIVRDETGTEEPELRRRPDRYPITVPVGDRNRR